MELYSIASGSSGNSIFAETSAENTGILLDAGISKKRIEEGLAQRQLSLDQVEAIFIHTNMPIISAGLALLHENMRYPFMQQRARYNTYGKPGNVEKWTRICFTVCGRMSPYMSQVWK